MVKTRSSSGFIAAIVAAAVLGQGCATSKQQALPKVEESNTVTATATVKGIDWKTRKVTLLGEDGKPYSFVASPQVRNLEQVNVGDTVKVKYTESLAVAVRRNDGSVPTASAAGAVERAKLGEKPGGTAVSVVEVSATIVAIDRTSNRVTLVGPEGNYRVLQVKDPKNLEGVQVGDMVHATYTESVGISVEPVPAAPKK
jgi:Cu/Ag efflux protein CusF